MSPYYDEDDIQRLKDTIAKQNKALREQDALLRSLGEPPIHIGIALTSSNTLPLVMLDGTMQEIVSTVPVQAGDAVRVAMPTEERPILAIVGTVQDMNLSGNIVTFERMEGALFEVSVDGRVQTIFPGKVEDVKEGDRLVLDKTGMIALRNLGQEPSVFTYDIADVKWEDIGGLREAKASIREAIEYPISHSKLLTAYNKGDIKGYIFHGPPGNGKTMLGKAAATAIRTLQGGTGPNPFLYVKGAEVLRMYVGQQEAIIRSIFARARKFRQQHGMSMAVFFDEADAAFFKRGSGISSDANNSGVASLLSEMDGFEGDGPFIMMATNRLDRMDPAVLRDERLARVIQINRPDREDAGEILRIHLAHRPLAKKVTVDGMADYLTGELFKSEHTVLQRALSGAMLKGIVERATSFALRRDIASAAPRISGLNLEDAISALRQAEQEQIYLQKG